MARAGEGFVMCERCNMPIRFVVEVGAPIIEPDGETATMLVVPLVDQHYCKTGPIAGEQ